MAILAIEINGLLCQKEITMYETGEKIEVTIITNASQDKRGGDLMNVSTVITNISTKKNGRSQDKCPKSRFERSGTRVDAKLLKKALNKSTQTVARKVLRSNLERGSKKIVSPKMPKIPLLNPAPRS